MKTNKEFIEGIYKKVDEISEQKKLKNRNIIEKISTLAAVILVALVIGINFNTKAKLGTFGLCPKEKYGTIAGGQKSPKNQEKKRLFIGSALPYSLNSPHKCFIICSNYTHDSITFQGQIAQYRLTNRAKCVQYVYRRTKTSENR